LALPATGWRRQRSGRARLTGLTISAPGWQRDLDAWCETVGLQPPLPEQGARGWTGSTRASRVNVTLVDGPQDGGPVLSLTAVTDNLDSLIERAKARGSDLLVQPAIGAGGVRSAVLSGPVGIQVRVEERQTRRIAAAATAPWRVEDYLLLSTATTAVLIAAAIGYFCHLAVLHAPHHQVTFGFLTGFCAVLAGLGALVAYPAGLIGGEDDHGQHTVHTLRSEVAGTDPTDLLSIPRARWQLAAQAGAIAGVTAAALLGLLSFAMLGRPVGFWLLWAWAGAAGATSVAVSSVIARKRGILLAGRRAHGLAVQSEPSRGMLRRVWLVGAVPFALSSALVNAGLGWSAYRFGVSTKTLSSDVFGAVVVTGGLLYLLGRQSGRADWRSGRLVVPERLLLPAKVRLGAQGLLYFMIAELIALNLVGHAIPHPPPVAAAVALRTVTSFLAGVAGFGLGAVAGALNQGRAEADEAVRP
jgi:hypothetical protein